MKTIICAIAITAVFVITVNSYADDMTDGKGIPAKQEICKFVSFSETLQCLEQEVKKGENSYTKQELQQLEKRLREYQDMHEKLYM